MNKQEKEEVRRMPWEVMGNEGYDYKYKNVDIGVDAELEGHGCLFEIRVPAMGTQFNPELPQINDVMKVLNCVFKDFHCGLKVVKDYGDENL